MRLKVSAADLKRFLDELKDFRLTLLGQDGREIVVRKRSGKHWAVEGYRARLVVDKWMIKYLIDGKPVSRNEVESFLRDTEFQSYKMEIERE